MAKPATTNDNDPVCVSVFEHGYVLLVASWYARSSTVVCIRNSVCYRDDFEYHFALRPWTVVRGRAQQCAIKLPVLATQLIHWLLSGSVGWRRCLSWPFQRLIHWLLAVEETQKPSTGGFPGQNSRNREPRMRRHRAVGGLFF